MIFKLANIVIYNVRNKRGGNMKFKGFRADLSGPVLAIIVTVGVIAAGLGLLAYFWWLAPNAGKTATLTVVGTPAMMVDSNGTVTVFATLKNVGNDAVQVKQLVLSISGTPITLNPDNSIISAGAKVYVTFTGTLGSATPSDPSYQGTLLTNAGAYPVTVYFVK